MKRLLILLFLPLVSSCNLAPRYARPSMELPLSYREYSCEASSANLRWWEEFEDPILDELIQIALENNKDLKVAMARVCEFFGRFQVVRSSLFPQIDLQGAAYKKRFPERTSFIPLFFDPITPLYEYQFNLSFELDFWGKIRNQTLAASAELIEQVENRRTVVLTLVSAVAESYADLRLLDRELEISYLTLKERGEYVDYARKRFLAGQTSEIEVTQALSLYDETLAAIAQIEEQIPQQENLISVLIGKVPTCIQRGKTIGELYKHPPSIPSGLPCEILVQRPDILSAENRLIAANAQIGAARAAFLPDFSLTGLFGGQSFQLNHLFEKPSRTWQIGGNFLQPIFYGGMLIGELNIAKAQYWEAFFSYEQTVLTALREVNDALIALKQSKELTAVEEDRVRNVAEYLRLAWLRYYNGQTEYITVLDAERQLFSAQIDLAKARGASVISLISLYKALGGGWVIGADQCLSN